MAIAGCNQTALEDAIKCMENLPADDVVKANRAYIVMCYFIATLKRYSTTRKVSFSKIRTKQEDMDTLEWRDYLPALKEEGSSRFIANLTLHKTS